MKALLLIPIILLSIQDKKIKKVIKRPPVIVRNVQAVQLKDSMKIIQQDLNTLLKRSKLDTIKVDSLLKTKKVIK